MYCPHCGQQQVANEVRFCSRCGFPLGGVAELLVTGGTLPASMALDMHAKELSPRQRGIRQGAMIMLTNLLVMPVVIFLLVKMFGMPPVLIPLIGSILFMGGLLRILYALLIEENTTLAGQQTASLYSAPNMPAQLGVGARSQALPPVQTIPAPVRRERTNTAEMVRPSSITEGTTRLLDDKPDSSQAK